MSVEHIFLDFDGTVMVYDEEPGFFHPEVIEALNRLPERGVNWYSNSGRCYESQLEILESCRKHGLKNLPVALLCGESFVFERSGDAYVGLEPWNSYAEKVQKRFHQQLQDKIRPQLGVWQKYVKPENMFMQEMSTYFMVEEGSAAYEELGRRYAAVVEELGEGIFMKNGCWLFAQPDGVNKGVVLEQYLKKTGLKPAEVLAIGDHENDLSMLDGRTAGRTGCPGNAVEKVKELVGRTGGYVSETEGPLGTLDVINCYLNGDVWP